MTAARSASFDGEDVVCRHCKSLMCIVPRDHITDVTLTCRCGANTRITYSPQGWRDIRVTDKARDAAMKVADAEIRLAKARAEHDRAVADIGRSAGKEFASGLTGSKAPIKNITHSGQAAGAATPGFAEQFGIVKGMPGVGVYDLLECGLIERPEPRRPWWKRMFRA